MLETRFIECPALSVDPRVRIFRSGSETDVSYVSHLLHKQFIKSFVISFVYANLRRITTFYECHSVFFVVANVTSLLKIRILKSLLTSHVNSEVTFNVACELTHRQVRIFQHR